MRRPERPRNIIYPRIILITGNMAAGKSSVAQALAERLPSSVHLRDVTASIGPTVFSIYE